jgi:hypothetical protein
LTSDAGIYFDEAGMISFYPMTWKVVSYLNLQPTRDLWRKVKSHYKSVVQYCHKLEKQHGIIIQIVVRFNSILVQKLNI